MPHCGHTKWLWDSDVITLFRIITMFYGTDNILWNIPHIQYECEEYFA